VGVEDTLVIGTAVTAAVKGVLKRPVLEDYCAQVDRLIEHGLGNLYVVRGYMLHPKADPAQMLASKKCVTDDPDGDLVRLLEYAARRGVHTMTIYTRMTRAVVDALKRRCGEFYLGANLGEITASGVAPGQRDMRTAARAWVRGARAAVRRAWVSGQPHVTCTLTNLFAKYCLEAGMDIPTAEIFTLPCVDVQYALLRGAARGYGRPLFGGWLATGWFSGSNRDPLKPVRCKLALGSGFLHGANFLIQESGHWGLYEFGDVEAADHPLCQAYRRIQGQFWAFAADCPRAADGPETRVGLVHGRFDGYSGLRGDVWGQPGWRPDDHEGGWELLKVFYPGAPNVNSSIEIQDRRRPRFSGTPYGLADIVPAEAPPERLARYRVLLFLGWNTMNAAQYEALVAYVRGGGTLVMWASHLNASADRNHVDTQHRFFRSGDFSDLFGVRVRVPRKRSRRRTWRPVRTYVNTVQWVRKGACGFPVGRIYYNGWPHGGVEAELAEDVAVLAVTDRGHPFVTERRLGKGRAVLVHCYSPQGQGNYREFAEDIFHAVGRRQLGRFRVEGDANVSYAVYGRGRRRTLYALNASASEDAEVTVVGLSTGPDRIRLTPGELVRVDWR